MVAAQKLEYQPIKCDLGFVVGTGETDQLTIKEHCVITRLAVVGYLFLIHTVLVILTCVAPSIVLDITSIAQVF